MCPKATFQNEIKKATKKVNRDIIESDNLEYTHLKFHNDPNALYQTVDIDMPYLIVYESVSTKGNQTTYQEFSENNKVLLHSEYSGFIKDKIGTPKLHSHNFYELTYVLSGELTLRIEDEDIVYHAGDCCICNKNIHHMEMMDRDTEFVLFLIKEEYIQIIRDTNYFYDRNCIPTSLETIFDVFFQENKKNPDYDAKIYSDYRLMDSAKSHGAFDLINKMIVEITGSQSGKSHMMMGLFCRLFEQLQNEEAYHEEVHRAHLSNEEQIVYEIAKAYRKKDGVFTRQEIEQITGYNGDYVERIFKKATGKTLLTYGKDILIKKAANLLVSTNLGIGDICERLGYSNRHYFNQIFQKEYGLTPSAFRKSGLEK